MGHLTYRIVHYINQFFAGVGGEEKADYPPVAHEGPIGPGKELQNLLGSSVKIVKTIVCGDNYFAANKEEVLDFTRKQLIDANPQLIIAGPSFYAGRYGFACGEVILEANKVLGIHGIAAMNEESPAVDMFSSEMFIVKTGDSARSMKDALKTIAQIAIKLLQKEEMKPASEEGYFSRGIRKNFFQDQDGAFRAVEMLVKKMKGQEFESEYLQVVPERVQKASPVHNLKKSKIAICTTGGVVPTGNPDRIESSAATKYGVYSFKGQKELKKEEFTSIHGGYDTSFAQDNPNRIVPIDVMREMEKTGEIGELFELFYSTTGTGASFKNGESFGRSIAEDLKNNEIDAVLLVST